MHEYDDYGTLERLVGQFLERYYGNNNFLRSIEKYRGTVRSAAQKPRL